MKKNRKYVLAALVMCAMFACSAAGLLLGRDDGETQTVYAADEPVIWDGTAAASFAGGAGTANDPYLISNGGELAYLASLINAEATNAVYGAAGVYYEQTCDIYLNATEGWENWASVNPSTTSLNKWTPIGFPTPAYGNVYFKAHFDGGGNAVFGLYINDSNASTLGLFGSVGSGAVIKNVGVEESFISGRGTIGGIAGSIYVDYAAPAAVTLENCYNAGSVNGAYDYIGGLVGSFRSCDADSVIKDCYNTGPVKAGRSGNNNSVVDGRNVGGIVGSVNNSVEDFKNSGTLTLEGCVNTGDVSGVYTNVRANYSIGSTWYISTVNNFGGIAGYVENRRTGAVTFKNCVNEGDVSTVIQLTSGSYDSEGDYLGGIIGRIENWWGSVTLDNCDNAGEVFGSYYGTGGIVGYLVNNSTAYDIPSENHCIATLSGCDNTGDVLTEGKYIGGVVGYTENNGDVTIEGCTNAGAVTGDHQTGGVAGYIENYGNRRDKYVPTLSIADCHNTGDVTGTKYATGRGYKVGGIVGELLNDYPYGGDISGDVTIEGCSNGGAIQGDNWIGGILGYLRNYGIADTELGAVAITDCFNTGGITAVYAYAGGIAGSIEHNRGGGVTVAGCYNEGVVTIEEAYDCLGGLIGCLENSAYLAGGGVVTVTHCYNAGDVGDGTAVGSVGGIAGYIYNDHKDNAVIIKNTYNSGAVAGGRYVGGIAGWFDLSDGLIFVENCYNLGAVEGDSGVGGIAGYMDSGAAGSKAVVENCYNAGAVSGESFTGGVAGRIEIRGTNLGEVSVTNAYFLQTASVNAGLEDGGSQSARAAEPTIDILAFGTGKIFAGDEKVTIGGKQYDSLVDALNAWVIGRQTNPVSYLYYDEDAFFTDEPPEGWEPPVTPTVTSVTVAPAAIGVQKGTTRAFTATVAGTTNPAQTVTWSVSGGASASTAITSDGVLTVGADETAATLTVTATSTADTSKSGTAAVTVSDVPVAEVTSVTVSPGTASVGKGGNQTFTAVVAGTLEPAQDVTWAVSGNSSASTVISTDGVLTVGADETAATLTVTATSMADSSKSGTATVTVTGEPPVTPTVTSVTVTPAPANVEKGKTQAFTAAVAGANNPAQTVTWAVSGNLSASTVISNVGVLTVGADETAATLTVTATSTVDGTKSGSATVTVTAPAVVDKPGGCGNAWWIILLILLLLLAVAGFLYYQFVYKKKRPFMFIFLFWKKYDVTFKSHDGAVLSGQKVRYWSAAAAPDAPVRAGYAFTGWDKKFDKVCSALEVNAVYAREDYATDFYLQTVKGLEADLANAAGAGANADKGTDK
ncbi:MAG: InlB B-repeat-containing protein [Firmicutes bacterium]|nr:InlB B-repeat-containing protein [Bacillota bacterium]